MCYNHEINMMRIRRHTYHLLQSHKSVYVSNFCQKCTVLRKILEAFSAYIFIFSNPHSCFWTICRMLNLRHSGKKTDDITEWNYDVTKKFFLHQRTLRYVTCILCNVSCSWHLYNLFYKDLNGNYNFLESGSRFKVFYLLPKKNHMRCGHENLSECG